jgi:hypothetical protein
MQDDATMHTANYSNNVLNEVFEERLISELIMACRVSRFKSLGLLSMKTPKKHKMYYINPHTLDEFKQKMCETVTTIEITEFGLVTNSLQET